MLFLSRPGERWPLLVGANRDERIDRAFDPPGRWWDDAPQIVAWRDRTSNGTWLGVNDGGTMATLVNGVDALGPLPGKSTRGALVLDALRERDAASGAHVIAQRDPARYGPFTLLVADRDGAHTVTNDGMVVRHVALPPGPHMLTPDGCDRAGTPRFDAYFPELRAATPPDPGTSDWDAWITLLRREDHDDPHHAMTVTTGGGFGTVASTLIGIPAGAEPPVVLFANGPPTRVPYVALRTPGFVT